MITFFPNIVKDINMYIKIVNTKLNNSPKLHYCKLNHNLRFHIIHLNTTKTPNENVINNINKSYLCYFSALGVTKRIDMIIKNKKVQRP